MQDDDLNLFLQEMSGVKPLSQDEVLPEHSEFSPTLAQQARRIAAEQEM